MSNNIRLVALPILPFVSGCFYGSKESITGIWNAEVEDPEFNNLPAKCVCGLSQIRYRNQWQLYRSRLHQTVGDVNLAINEQGIFKKFDMKMPEFNSIRDYFFLSNSPCENGFLAEVYMFDATNDPSIERLQNPRYASPYAPKIGLSWLSRNGRRDDIKLPANFSGIPHVSGSFDRSRVVVWAGINNEPAAASKYPWTKSLNSEWHPIDLSNIYKKDKLFEINRMNDTLIIELPKLIDPRGIGKTFDEQFLKSSGRN